MNAAAKHIAEQNLEALRKSDFWQSVARSDGCWRWSGAVNEHGYGRFFTSDRIEYRAHRVAFALGKNTALPGVVMVCHRCDNPACCNPDHLFIGLAADNNQDCLTKGRHITPTGRANGNGKLSDKQVAEIKASNASGLSMAKKFSVSPALVSMIRQGRRRQMVGGPGFEPGTPSV